MAEQPKAPKSNTCEWMFGDAATGLLGFNATASLNPLRWSGSISFKEAYKQLEEVQKHKDRPIIVKIPPGFTSKEHKFGTVEEALSHLRAHDPDQLASCQERVDVWQRRVEETLEAKTAAEQAVAEAKRLLAEADKERDAAGAKMIEWMFADAGASIPLGTFFARFNPTRWSGPQTYTRTLKDMDDLLDKGGDERNRSVRVKEPPNTGTETDFPNCEKVIEYLKKDMPGDDPVRELQDAAQDAIKNEEQARENHRAAEENLQDARNKLEAEKAKQPEGYAK